MDKEITISNGRVLSYTVTDGYVPMHTIREIYFAGDEFICEYSLSRWDDYMFYALDFGDKDKITFYIDVEHPLYFPLLHLLNGDSELLIDDDDTLELKKKYMRVYMNQRIICLEFNNKFPDKSAIRRENFRVFIKNVGHDFRSKIDDQYLDTKKRLTTFFSEAIQAITEENHQITIEEYMIKRKSMV